MSDAAFEKALEQYMTQQIAQSTGERLRRLTSVNRYAETLFLKNVWWPMFGNFDHLEAELEVPDLVRGYRYLDFAYILPPLRIDIEIEGFGNHAKHADRGKFEDDHLRAAFLQAGGWEVVRISHDTVKERPHLVRQVLTLMIGKWSTVTVGSRRMTWTEEDKEIIRFAIRKQGPITPNEICEATGICNRTARRRLHQLVGKGAFRPARGNVRVRAYEICVEKTDLFLGM